MLDQINTGSPNVKYMKPLVELFFFKSHFKCIKVRVPQTHFPKRIPYPAEEMAALPVDALMAHIFLIPTNSISTWRCWNIWIPSPGCEWPLEALIDQFYQDRYFLLRFNTEDKTPCVFANSSVFHWILSQHLKLYIRLPRALRETSTKFGLYAVNINFVYKSGNVYAQLYIDKPWPILRKLKFDDNITRYTNTIGNTGYSVYFLTHVYKIN
jgi:hypothetical protein